MTLFGKKTSTVGLDIGSGLIKVAVVDHSKKEPQLTKVAIQPVPQDAIVEGEVMDPGVVAEAIQAALSKAGVKTKQVVTAVGGRDGIIKKVSIGGVEEEEARGVVGWGGGEHGRLVMECVGLGF